MLSKSLLGVLLLYAILGATGVLGQSWTAESWSNCGGSQFCPCGTSNCDHQWPDVQCKKGDVCVRQNPQWWRCEPRDNACWNKIETWGACGGKDNCPGGTSNCNVPWKGHCCNSGDVCTRQNDNWWRCEPLDRYTESHTCKTYAGTWNSCGDRKCCSTPGDICVYKTDEWSRCEPTGNQAPAPPRGNPPKPLEIRGSQIVAAGTDEQVQLRGINWFGYNVARQMVDGLNYGGADAQTDFATIVYQLRMLGFNIIRLPFRYRDLDEQYPKDYTVKCWDMSTEDKRRRLMAPGMWTKKQLPQNNAAIQRNSGYCNNYLPSSSTYARLMYTIQTIVSQGMYVMLDYQPMGTEPQAYNVKEFVCKWRSLVSRVKSVNNWEEDIKGRVFIDVMNEPDSMGIKWEPSSGHPGARELYLETLDALHSMVPEGLLYILEGTGQNNFGLNWGNGFITDTNIIRKYGISDANYFFRQLVSKPYVNKVVMSPHVYPPSVTKASFLGDSLWQQSSIAFGYLQTQGYCNDGKCTVFPVVIGETGSFLSDWSDKQWMADFADFINARGGARSYNSQSMAGWLWWCYNENSHDTGGIVWDNWKQLDWNKLGFMINSLGLTPWYKDEFVAAS
ncbi:hypothetical protein OEZ85_003433 [Tetradesmus obliquus]|uniref:Glycoside hydrolase family 5 domain-containing protein n=1 Tax=Tetradesmus obliquus TaxID=3088 RepID=A0ABY8UDL0_TETOB|nr:hypothetical protein OEZ85_003433 [Tetradesmus obliquus]